jgi:hypothetical protein
MFRQFVLDVVPKDNFCESRLDLVLNVLVDQIHCIGRHRCRVCAPLATAGSVASRDHHSSSQSTATPLSQLASSLPNGWDIVASADSFSSCFSLFFFLFDLPFISCIGVSSAIAGSSANGFAFLACCSLAIISRCLTSLDEHAFLFFGCCDPFAWATSIFACGASRDGAIFWGAFCVGPCFGSTVLAWQPGGRDFRN